MIENQRPQPRSTPWRTSASPCARPRCCSAGPGRACRGWPGVLAESLEEVLARYDAVAAERDQLRRHLDLARELLNREDGA